MKGINNSKYYLFDYDGTLVDSMNSFSQVMYSFLDEYNISYQKDIIKILTPLGYDNDALYLKENYGIQMSAQNIKNEIIDRLYIEYSENIKLKPFVKEYLLYLKNNGKDINVLTAAPHKLLDICLKNNGVYDLFSNVWSCEDFSLSKAEPYIYNKISEKLKCEVNDIVFFDDNINAIRGAKKSGVLTVGVYDYSGNDFIDEMKETADNYINSFNELINV